MCIKARTAVLLSGYESFFRNNSSNGGGLVLFIEDGIAYRIYNELSI